MQFYNLIKHICIYSLLVTLLSCCSDEKESMDFVDLRYEVEDKYELTASNPKPITFRVRSTKEWNVFSKHNQDWSEITPNYGEPDKDYDVTVSYKDNTELDDRIDTIVIKSDYWIGKEVEVFQKGTAYLRHSDIIDMLSKDGEDVEIQIYANQKWSVDIKEGSEWLTIVSADNGEFDGSVKFNAMPNQGERRTAKIDLIDRHGEVKETVELTQDGIQLDVDLDEIKIDYDQPDCVISVLSNTRWSIVKDEKAWYSVKDMQSVYEGNKAITINIEKNLSQNVRVAYVDLKSVADDGSKPIVKRVYLKQAYLPAPVIHEFDNVELPEWEFINGKLTFDGDVSLTGSSSPRMAKYKIELGKYMFNVKSMTQSSMLRIYFILGAIEIRCHLDASTGKTSFSTAPYSPVNEKPEAKTDFVYTKENSVGVELSSTDDGYIYIKWLLNGKVICEQVANHGEFIIPANKELDIVIDAKPGNVTLDRWEYSKLMDWNNVGL